MTIKQALTDAFELWADREDFYGEQPRDIARQSILALAEELAEVAMEVLKEEGILHFPIILVMKQLR